MEDLIGRRVLVVDDETLVGLVSREIAVDLGCRVAAVADAGSALKLLETETFDILLSDIRMPGMNGIELARKAQARHSALVVVLCSGDASSWSIELRGTAWPVLQKPFTEPQLAAAIRTEWRDRIGPSNAAETRVAACG